MATPFPILNVPTIVEPCTQSWELMPGTSRVRHCATCNQDVVNLAAMSAAAIARLLQGPLPCLRIARYDDGTLVTTEPPTRRPLPRIAAGLLTAAMAVGAAAQNPNTTMGVPPPAPQPHVTGRVTDHFGQPIPQATATLLKNGKVVATLKLGPDASYTLNAPAGLYELHVQAPGSTPRKMPVTLSPQKILTLPVELAPERVVMGKIAPPPTVTMGVPPLSLKATAPRTVQH